MFRQKENNFCTKKKDNCKDITRDTLQSKTFYSDTNFEIFLIFFNEIVVVRQGIFSLKKNREN